MDYLKVLTGIYYLGIGCGLWTKTEVIDWCDKVIEAIDSPPYEILEVSMMSKSKIDDIENKLFPLSELVDVEYSVNLVLSIIFEKLKLEKFSVEQAIRSTCRLLVHSGLYWESKYYDLYSFDDSYDLAKDGIYFTLTNVEEEFNVGLKKYSKYISEFKEMYIKVTNKEWNI